jgi:hypothetical protein
MKQCNKCHIEKPFTEFSKDKSCKKDGFMRWCKLCMKQNSARWYNDNKDLYNTRYKAKMTEWQNNNQDRLKLTKQRNNSKIPPAIYKITNEINGRQYVGQSIKPHRRKLEHFTITTNPNSRTSHHSLQAEIKQYGKHNFKFEIIEHCEINKLDEREQYWIDVLQPHYNSQPKTLLETLKTTN